MKNGKKINEVRTQIRKSATELSVVDLFYLTSAEADKIDWLYMELNRLEVRIGLRFYELKNRKEGE